MHLWAHLCTCPCAPGVPVFLGARSSRPGQILCSSRVGGGEVEIGSPAGRGRGKGLSGKPTLCQFLAGFVENKKVLAAEVAAA